FVRKQMARQKVPILLLTSSAKDGNRVMDALDAGAVDFVQKPSALANNQILSIREQLTEKVKAAAQAQVLEAPATSATPLEARSLRQSRNVDIVLLGVSTGGPQALRQLLPQMPGDFPVPIAIVLHMPVGYTAMFAERLNEICQLDVREAT